jgi:hypothetical protein
VAAVAAVAVHQAITQLALVVLAVEQQVETLQMQLTQQPTQAAAAVVVE